MGSRLLRLAGFASGALAGTLAYRRLLGGGGERIDVYFDDGSFVTFAGRLAGGDNAASARGAVLVAAGRA